MKSIRFSLLQCILLFILFTTLKSNGMSMDLNMDSRNKETVLISIVSEDTLWVEGSIRKCSIRVAGMSDLKSLQFSINWNPNLFTFNSSRDYDVLSGINENNLGLNRTQDGLLTVSLAATGANNINLPDNTILFTLYLKARENVECGDISISNSPTPIEVYIGNTVAEVNTTNLSVCIRELQCQYRDSVNPITCFGGNNASIQILNLSCPEVEVRWSTGETGTFIDRLPPGTYSAELYINGAPLDKLGPWIISQPVPLEFKAVSVGPLNCHNHTNAFINVTVQGGTGPLKYQWNNGTEESNIKDIGPGSYNLTVRDASACRKDTTLIISNPEALILNLQISSSSSDTKNDGSITMLVSGGTSPYRYYLNDATSTMVINNLGTGNYKVSAEDAKGCRLDTTAQVKTTAKGLTFYNFLTPNGDGHNDKLNFEAAHIIKELRVYNRWNKLLYLNTQYNNDWDGTDMDGNKLNGVFYYILTYAEGEHKKSISKSITILTNQ